MHFILDNSDKNLNSIQNRVQLLEYLLDKDNMREKLLIQNINYFNRLDNNKNSYLMKSFIIYTDKYKNYKEFLEMEICLTNKNSENPIYIAMINKLLSMISYDNSKIPNIHVSKIKEINVTKEIERQITQEINKNIILNTEKFQGLDDLQPYLSINDYKNLITYESKFNDLCSPFFSDLGICFSYETLSNLRQNHRQYSFLFNTYNKTSLNLNLFDLNDNASLSTSLEAVKYYTKFNSYYLKYKQRDKFYILSVPEANIVLNKLILSEFDDGVLKSKYGNVILGYDNENFSDVELFVQLILGRHITLVEYKKLYDSDKRPIFFQAFMCLIKGFGLKTSWIPTEIINDFKNNSFNIDKYKDPSTVNIGISENILYKLDKFCNIFNEINNLKKKNLEKKLNNFIQIYTDNLKHIGNINLDNGLILSRINEELSLINQGSGIYKIIQEIMKSPDKSINIQSLHTYIINLMKDMNIDCDNVEIMKNELKNNIKI